jgi:hypothetical protein
MYGCSCDVETTASSSSSVLDFESTTIDETRPHHTKQRSDRSAAQSGPREGDTDTPAVRSDVVVPRGGEVGPRYNGNAAPSNEGSSAASKECRRDLHYREGASDRWSASEDSRSCLMTVFGCRSSPAVIKSLIRGPAKVFRRR